MRLGIAALLVGLTLASSSARAQEEMDAERAFTCGERAVARARLAEAHDCFRRSLELAPRAPTAFNLAVVARQMGALDEALEVVDQLLAGRYGALSTPQRGRIEALREGIVAALGTLVLTVDAAEPVEIRVDGRRLDPASRPLALEVPLVPGEHILRVSSPHASREQTFEIAAAQRFELTIELPAAPVLPVEPEPASSSVLDSPWPWIIGAIVLVAAGVGIGLGVYFADRDALPEDLVFGEVAALRF